tara:strand:+ start:62 stop:235 length:174 start_codon:yes stop_codon:yes gene_type:complete
MTELKHRKKITKKIDKKKILKAIDTLYTYSPPPTGAVYNIGKYVIKKVLNKKNKKTS